MINYHFCIDFYNSLTIRKLVQQDTSTLTCCVLRFSTCRPKFYMTFLDSFLCFTDYCKNNPRRIDEYIIMNNWMKALPPGDLTVCKLENHHSQWLDQKTTINGNLP